MGFFWGKRKKQSGEARPADGVRQSRQEGLMAFAGKEKKEEKDWLEELELLSAIFEDED